MRPRVVAAALGIAVCLLVACSSNSLRAKFPLEEEVRGKLQKGMTAEQVLETFGEPPGHQWVDVKLGGKVHYLAPAAARTRREVGYAGFTVFFNQGKVWDWEVILLNPSYDPRVLPAGASSWQVQLVIVALIVVGGFFGLRYARAYSSGRREFLEAYAARAMPEAELPPDFRFLTHDTTRAVLLERAGTPSRVTKLPMKQAPGEADVEVLEYELTDDATLFVMPEHSTHGENRIRAVVYRRSR